MHKRDRHRNEAHDFRQPPEDLSRPPPNIWWGFGAAYAPGFPIYDFQLRRHRFPDVFGYQHVLPRPTEDVPKAPYHVRPSPLAGKTHHFHIPKTPKPRVRFDLPPRDKGHRGEKGKHEPHHDRKPPPTPAHRPHRSNHQDRRKPILKPDIHHRPSKQDLRDHTSPQDRPCHEPRMPPQKSPKPHVPTVHILTYSLQCAPHSADVKSIFARYLPPRTKHLYTIPAHYFTPPPEDICRSYSGVSPIIQDHVMRDEQARRAVRLAIDDILAFGRKAWAEAQRDGRGIADVEGSDVAVSACCLLGTHRSVSVAERIAWGVQKYVERYAEGVRVRVVHVHRVVGKKDPY